MRNYLAAIGLAGLAFSAPAEATYSSLTWQGIFASGTLTTDSSAAPIEILDLAGKSFALTFFIDDGLGMNESDLPQHAYLHGPTGDMTDGPVTAALTIEGSALAFNFPGFPPSYGGTTGNSSVERFDRPAGAGPDSARFETDFDWYWEDSAGSTNYGSQQLIASIMEQDPALFGTLFNSAALDAVPIRALTGSDAVDIAIHHHEYYAYVEFLDGYYSVSTRIDLDAVAHAARIVGGPIAAVPEPASWALMIGGLALAGLVQRRHRRLSVSFA